MEFAQNDMKDEHHVEGWNVSVFKEDCLNTTFGCNGSSDPANQKTDSFQYAYIIEIVVPIIFGLVFLLGLFGNTMVVLVIIANKQMKTTTNYLIVSLAVADLLFIVFCVPFTATDYILPSWPFGEIWCKVVQYLTYVTAYASVFTLLLLSIDRYFAVVHPVSAMSIRTEGNAVCGIFCTWLVILCSCVPIYLAHGITIDRNKDSVLSHCKFNTPQYSETAFRIGFFWTMYFIPLVTILFLYAVILRTLWRRQPSSESSRCKKRVTRLVVVIVGTFMVCWLPIQVVLLLRSLGAYEMNVTGIIFQLGAQVLAYTNSCLNPILYAFLSKPIRKSFGKLIYCQSRCWSGPSSNNIRHMYRDDRFMGKVLSATNVTNLHASEGLSQSRLLSEQNVISS